MVVLACTLAAWATSYVHSFKNSLWGMAAVVAFISIECCNQIYFSWQWSTVSRVEGGSNSAPITRGSQSAATAPPWRIVWCCHSDPSSRMLANTFCCVRTTELYSAEA